MIEIIVFSREKDRSKRYNTRLKKIKPWITEEFDLDNTQYLFRAKEEYQIDGTDDRLPIVVFKLRYTDSLVIDALGKDIPSSFQIANKIKEMFVELLKIVEEKAEKKGYQVGFSESERLHSEQ